MKRPDLSERNRTHGLRQSPLYPTWVNMRRRCADPKNPEFKRYGARGIAVCERWMDFANFHADMGERPAGKTLDRIDNNGPYCPENCRWADAETQNHNKRSNRYIEWRGQRRTITDWSRSIGIQRAAIKYRMKRGWSLDDVFTKPADPRFVAMGHRSGNATDSGKVATPTMK